MKASELIEKIHNKEIKSGTKIIYHKKNEYFDYKIIRWYMGNWFSKVPPEKHTSDDDFDRDFILELCDKSVTYEIIEEEKEIEEIEVENGHIVDYDETGKHYITTNRKDRNIYINKINELVREIRKLKDKQ